MCSRVTRVALGSSPKPKDIGMTWIGGRGQGGGMLEKNCQCPSAVRSNSEAAGQWPESQDLKLDLDGQLGLTPGGSQKPSGTRAVPYR